MEDRHVKCFRALERLAKDPQGVSRNPFTADAATAARLAGQDGAAIRAAASHVLHSGQIGAADVAALVGQFALPGPHDLMCHLIETATGIARPPISDFHVGAVRLTAGGGLILGGNVEFPGTTLHQTIHGEGFVAIRAFQSGQRLCTIALSEAHPCGHCRQMLSEFAGAEDLILLDPLGHLLRLADLYPWPFGPAYLDQPGAISGASMVRAVAGDLPDAVASALAMAPVHAPYSESPAVLALDVEGQIMAGGSFENAAFNPSLGPGQTAMIALIAQGLDPARITRAWLAQVPGACVDHGPPVTSLLRSLAPSATLTQVAWA